MLIDKPISWTSSDVVQKLRGELNVRKIGHAGTLDPMATGLLILCIGKGTKSSESLTGQDKVYSGVMKLGESTPSYDAETPVSETKAWEHLTDADLQKAAEEHFTGEIMQIPPIYSAIKVGGRKMYEAARAGEDIRRDPRKVVVHEFRVWRDDSVPQPSPYVNYKIHCGKGTYVRSLIHDLAEQVDTKAHVTKLQRDSSGSFQLSDAWQLEDVLASAQELGLRRKRSPKAEQRSEAASQTTAL